MSPRYVRVRIDSIVVHKPDDMSEEPGSFAEWYVQVELPGGLRRVIGNEWVAADTVLPVNIQSSVIDLQADPNARFFVVGFEHDSSSANDELPTLVARLATLPTGAFTVSAPAHAVFEYEVRGWLTDLDASPWHVVSPTGLAYYGWSERNEVWHSGRAMSAVAFDRELAAVGSDTGGLWTALLDSSICHSNAWADPDIRAIGHASRWPSSLLVGTRQGWLYSAGAVGPATAVSSDASVLAGFGGSINQLHLATHRGEPVWLMATSVGVWWSLSGFTSGRWIRALDSTGRPAVIAAFSITAIGRSSDPTVVVGLERGTGGTQVATARFTPQGLVFDAVATVTSPVPGNTMNVSVCASPLDKNPRRMYLLCFEDSQDAPASGLFRSDDLGRTWARCAMNTGDAIYGSFTEVAGTQRNGGLFRHVAIHPTDPHVVAVPGLHTQVSVDGGAHSLTLTGEGFHEDSHEVRFANPDGDMMVIASDGGVLLVEGLTAMIAHGRARPGEARAAVKLLRGDSRLNRFLPTLQVSGVLRIGGGYYGAFSASSDGAADGVIAVGLQDNGQLERSFSMTGEWRRFGGGDGTMMATTPSGIVLGVSQEVAHSLNPDAGDVVASRIENGLSGVGVPPVLLAGTAAKLSRQVEEDLVLATARGGGWTGGAPVYAAMRNRQSILGGPQEDITLLELRWTGLAHEWRQVIAPWPRLRGTVSSMAVDGGAYIAIGTDQGEIVILETATMSVRVPRLVVGPGSPSTDRIQSIDVVDDRGVYAVTFGGVLWFIPFAGAPRAIPTWPIASAIRSGSVAVPVAVAALRSQALGLALATGRDVVISLDDGLTWRAASTGLPVAPHLNGLRTVDMGGEEYLLASTWGRSLWQAAVSQLLHPASVG